MHLKAVIGALLTLTLAACGEVAELKDILALSQAIAARYEIAPSINVSNGKVLTVTFENSKYAELPAAEREQFAREVAQFTYASFPRRDSIATIRIGFRAVKGAAGFSVTRSEVPYSWPVAELRPIADTTKPPATR